MIKIKLDTHNYSSEIKNEFLAHTPHRTGKWENFEFIVNEPVSECDYWVVVDCLPKKETVLCLKDHSIFITGEPTAIKRYNQKFLNQFSKIITGQHGIQHSGVYEMPTGHNWWPHKSFDELYGQDKVEKTKLISIIASNKSYTPGHKKRFEFCLNLKKYFGDKIDMFGRGTRDFEDKWDVLAAYKYSIAIENSVEPNYISEKFTDCFTALTFPFYYGCPRADKFYDASSFQFIDIDNFEKSCRIIETIINDQHHYNRHLQNLIESKNKYLTKLHIVPLIANFIKKEYGNTANNLKDEVTIRPEKEFQKIKYFINDIKKFLVRVKIKVKI